MVATRLWLGRLGQESLLNEEGRNITVTDGLWIIELGRHGFVGLISLYLLQLFGPIALSRQIRFQRLKIDGLEVANAAGVSIICGMAALDSLPNAMVIPLFTAVAGAAVSASRMGRIQHPSIEQDAMEASGFRSEDVHYIVYLPN